MLRRINYPRALPAGLAAARRKLLLPALLLPLAARAQAPRLHDAHALAWLVYVGDHRVADKWLVHTEVQLRRVDWLRAPQQELYRLGLVRRLGERLKVSAGYTFFQSHRYGAYAEVPGRVEPEHRAYEDVTLGDQLGRLGLSQRLRLEQRWLGNRDAAGQGAVRQWQYQHRIRYQLELQLPLQGPTLDDREWYLTGFDEVFLSFGPNVGLNVLNQNRLAGGLGYRLGRATQLELVYLYQVRPHATPDPATQQPVVELNHGLRLTVAASLDFRP